MTQEEKEHIDRLVGIWLTGLQSCANDAGWEGMSLAARLIEYMGEPPGPTGNDQSNLTMINAIRLLRGRHAEFPAIAAAMSMLLRMPDTRDLALAIAARNYYQGLCDWTGKTWTDHERASMHDMTFQEFRWALEKAYPAVQRELDRVSVYSRFIA